MGLRILRVGVAVLLGASGALMYAASWQRWAGACLPGGGRRVCGGLVEDHRYDFIAPREPWTSVGDASQLAGASMLVLALAFLPLPWALTGRRPGVFSAVVLVAVALATGAVGVATYRSGVVGSIVDPAFSRPASYLWSLVGPALLVRFGFAARGWALGAVVLLVLSTPVVAAFTYAIGPYDSAPWYEAVSGFFIAGAGACLLVAAAVEGRFRRRGSAVAASPSPSEGATAPR